MDKAFIPQMEPWFDQQEVDHLVSYFQSGGWGTEFERTREFERMICEYTGARFCSILPNGTISLTVALQACGIRAGDEVIVPDYTMVATPNAAELLGARAVFVDVELHSMCMDFDCMLRAVTGMTRAVIVVSINGRYPSRIDKIVEYCQAKGLALIEDAAQSLGSFSLGKHIGRQGVVGSFSFSMPKIITTGQGGALITDDAEIIRAIRLVRDFGRERGGIDHYLVKGWNYKFTDIQAVIGIEQMKKLEWRVTRKREIDRMYRRKIDGVGGISMPPISDEGYTPWFHEILVEDRVGLAAFLKARGIGTREFYPPLHSEPAYGYNDQQFPVTEEISKKGLWLPSASKLSDEQVSYVCDAIRQFALA